MFSHCGQIFSKRKENAKTIYKLFIFSREMVFFSLPANFYTVESIHSKIPVTSNLSQHIPKLKIGDHTYDL